MKTIAICLVLMGCGLGELTPEQRAAQEQRRAERVAQEAAATAIATQRLAAFGRLREIIQNSGPPATSCPQPDIDGARVQAEFLSLTFPTMDYATVRGEPDAAWSWLDDGHIGVMRAAAEDPARAGRVRMQTIGEPKNRYLAVVVRRDSEMPRVIDEPGLIDSGEFQAGFIEGDVRIVDLDEGTVVCARAFESESGSRVGGEDLGDAVVEDFKEQTEIAINGALDRMAQNTRVSFGWI